MGDYVGRLGKDRSWLLGSEHPYVVFDKQESRFTGYNTLREVEQFTLTESHKVYAFSQYSGRWEELHFVAFANPGEGKQALGFRAD